MRKLMRSALMTLVLVPGLATMAHAGVVVYDFDTQGFAASATPFDYTLNGLTAHFSSPADPSAFMIADGSIFLTLSNNVLTGGETDLVITFDSPQASLFLNFATFSADALNLTAFLGGTGGTQVGTNSALGTMPRGGDFPEGTLDFNGGTFDTIVLNSATTMFAVDNVTVTDSATPEPGTFLLCGGVLAALSCVRLRRRIF